MHFCTIQAGSHGSAFGGNSHSNVFCSPQILLCPKNFYTVCFKHIIKHKTCIPKMYSIFTPKRFYDCGFLSFYQISSDFEVALNVLVRINRHTDIQNFSILATHVALGRRLPILLILMKSIHENVRDLSIHDFARFRREVEWCKVFSICTCKLLIIEGWGLVKVTWCISWSGPILTYGFHFLFQMCFSPRFSTVPGYLSPELLLVSNQVFCSVGLLMFLKILELDPWLHYR